MGLVPDPRSPGRFFIANPCTSKIESFRDLHQAEFKPDLGEDLVNEGKLHDFSYPDEKPPHTIRILLVGRCYLYWQASGSPYEKIEEGNRTKDFMWTLAKRTQILLNTRAALEGSPYHYEVFNGGMHHGSRYTDIWANYVVPPAVQKYGIDLVLIMQEQGIGSVIPFLQTPITSEGIPADGEDPEYLLTPISEKLKGGPVRDFFDLCRRRKVLMEASKINWDINMDKALDDTQVRPALVDLLKMPLVTLKKRMENAKFEGGKTAKMEVWYYPITPYIKRKDRDLARDVCLKAGVPFLDICDDFDVLSSTYHPYRIPAEEPGYFTRNGMDLFAQIMVHELLKNHTIPFDAPSAR